jgi:hypothetical protein
MLDFRVATPSGELELRLSALARGSDLLRAIAGRLRRADLRVTFLGCEVAADSYIAVRAMRIPNVAFVASVRDSREVSVLIRHRRFRLSVAGAGPEGVEAALRCWFTFGGHEVHMRDGRVDCGCDAQQRLLLMFARGDAWHEFGLDDTADRLQEMYRQAHFFQRGVEVLREKGDLLRTVVRGEPLWVEGATQRCGMSLMPLISPTERLINVLLIGDDEVTRFVIPVSATIGQALAAVREGCRFDPGAAYALAPLDGGDPYNLAMPLDGMKAPCDFALIAVSE